MEIHLNLTKKVTYTQQQPYQQLNSILTTNFSRLWGNFFEIFCAIPLGSADLFSKENGSGIDSVVVPMSRDRLIELTFIAMHSHAVLILKRNFRPHRTTTSSLFNEALFTRYFGTDISEAATGGVP